MSKPSHGLGWVYKVDSIRHEIIGPNGETICDWDMRGRSGPPSKTHAEFIVRACNAHDGLVAESEKAADKLDRVSSNSQHRLRAAIAKAKP